MACRGLGIRWMLLVLTYHRIVKSREGIADFFDVTAAELERQIRRVTGRWQRCVTPETLVEERCEPDKGKRGFLITLDDGTTDHYDVAAPLLERLGVRGVFFVNTARLGRTGYLNSPQCVELQARGHFGESHSHEHKRLTQLSAGVLHRHLAESRRILRNLGLGEWDFLAPPGGYIAASTLQAAKAEGYRMVRTLNWGYNCVANPLSVQSITVNRSTAGRCFGLMVSPRCEGVKRAFYCVKEAVKRGSLSSLYFGLREPSVMNRRAALDGAKRAGGQGGTSGSKP